MGAGKSAWKIYFCIQAQIDAFLFGGLIFGLTISQIFWGFGVLFSFTAVDFISLWADSIKVYDIFNAEF